MVGDFTEGNEGNEDIEGFPLRFLRLLLFSFHSEKRRSKEQERYNQCHPAGFLISCSRISWFLTARLCALYDLLWRENARQSSGGGMVFRKYRVAPRLGTESVRRRLLRRLRVTDALLSGTVEAMH